jgi:fatty acid metabolism transcriptional regulator FadR
MLDLLTPLRSESLKEVFVLRFEELILSGRLSIGQKLPSERELALQLGVSRPVVHEGLVDLAAKGLITLKPRIGAVVNDYRREGSPDILESLFNYHNGSLDPKILQGILSMRMLLESEIARLAAQNRSQEQLLEFDSILHREKQLKPIDVPALTQIDFEFHHLLTIASGNFIYPLLMNSMKKIYTNLSGQFYSDPGVVPIVFTYHRELVTAIAAKDQTESKALMKKLLKHGEQRFEAVLDNQT